MTHPENNNLVKTLYKTMERFEKVVVIGSLLFAVGLVAWLATPLDWSTGIAGLFGKGDGWWFFPIDVMVPLASFLGAFAYSGGGGNLNFAQSHYIKEKGFGMGIHSAKITSLLNVDSKPQIIHGALFSDTCRKQRHSCPPKFNYGGVICTPVGGRT